MKVLGVYPKDLERREMWPLMVGYLFVLAVALVAGRWVGQGQQQMLLILVGAAALSLVMFVMQKRAWILIVVGWLFTGNLLVLRLPFAVRDVMIIMAFCAYLAYRVVSERSVRAGWNLIDALLVVNLVYVAIGWILHPVGFRVLGAQQIGARPYLNIALAVVGYWLLVHLPDSVKTVSRIPYYFLMAATAISTLQSLVYLFPSLVPYIFRWYADVDITAYVNSLNVLHGYQRFKGLVTFGLYTILVLCSYYSLGSLFNPFRGRFYAMLIGGMCVLASGFRGVLLACMAAMGIGGWLQRRWGELAVGTLAGALLVGALVTGQGRLYDLPPAVQRTLCFLPGQWDTEVAADARGSSEWRFQLWRNVIENRLIKDWWLGDGFGANIFDLVLSARNPARYTEFITQTGTYHSGPLTTIRYVGIIGLLLLYTLSIAGAIHAYKTVQQCWRTPLFSVAVFLGIRLIWGPVEFTAVYGAFDSYLPDLIIQLGVLRLLMRFCDQGFAVPATVPKVKSSADPTMAATAA